MATNFNAKLTLSLANKVSRPAKKVDQTLAGLGERTDMVSKRMRTLASDLDRATSRLNGMRRAVRQLAQEEKRFGGLGSAGSIGGAPRRSGRRRTAGGTRGARGSRRRSFLDLGRGEQVAQIRSQEETKQLKSKIRGDLGIGKKGRSAGGNLFAGANLAQTAQAMDRVSMGLQRIGSDVLHTGADFEKGITRIEGIAGEGFKGTSIAEEVMQNAAAFGDTQGQVDAYYQAVSSGAKNAEQAQATLSAANRLAIVDNSDVATSLDGITNALNAYGMSQDHANEVAGIFFTAVKDGKTTVDEISNSIGRVAPTALQLGVEMDELAAAFGAATKQGIAQTETVSGLKAAFANVLKPTKDAQKEAKKLGIDFSKANLKKKGLQGFLAEISQARVKKGKDKGRTADIEKLFGSVEAFNTISALTANNMEEFNAVLADTATGGEDFAKAFGKANETTAQQLARAEAKFDKLKITLSDSLIPVLTDVLTTTMPLVDQFGTWAKQNPQTVATLVKLGAGIFAISKVGAVTADVLAGAQGVAGGLKAVHKAGVALDGVMANRLPASMNKVAGVAGIAAAAFVGWKIGKWIDEMTGASDWIANEIARWSGLNAAQKGLEELSGGRSDERLAAGDVTNTSGPVTLKGGSRARGLQTRKESLQRVLAGQEGSLEAERKGMQAFSQSGFINDLIIGAGSKEGQIEQTRKQLAEVEAQLAAIQGGKNVANAKTQNAQLEVKVKDERTEVKVTGAEGFDVNAVRSS